MRIVKAEATGVLDSNASRLEEQIGRCQAEIDKFSRMALVGFSGVASDALVSRIRGQVPVLYAQKAFYSSLKEAERSNSSAVAGLPETSPGVLDTDVAQQRIDEARESVDSLRLDQAGASKRQPDRAGVPHKTRCHLLLLRQPHRGPELEDHPLRARPAA
ncbi:MAG: hypothetical protein MR874_04335, partial [Coriobacteriaceae bacterium]|nr:hypothetical protein [Coriobacteriaceae bacterium]